MQANNTDDNIFDEEFFDQAWQNMNETLDKEMPQEKKRRRFLLWFFLMASCVIGFLFWKGLSLNPQLPTENILQIPIAKSVETPSNQITQNNSIPQPIREKVVANKTITNDLKDGLNFDSKKTPATYPTPHYQKVLPIILDDSKMNLGQNQQELILSVATLPSLSISLLENNDDDLVIKDKYVVTDENLNLCPPKRKIEYQVLAGLIHDFSAPKKVGITTGIEMNFPIRKKWSIQTGVVFSLLPKNGFIQTSQNHEAVLGNNSTINPNQFDLNLYSVYTTSQYQLKNIKYLEVPLLATYQLGGKWKLKAGINWSTALNANVELVSNQELLIDNDPNSILTLNELETRELSAPFVQEEIWKNNFVSGVLGVSWNSSKRLSLNLQYHQRWSDISFINFSENSTLDDFSLIGGPANATSVNEAFHQRKDFYQSFRLIAGYRF